MPVNFEKPITVAIWKRAMHAVWRKAPEESWTTQTYKNSDGQCCAMGHLQEEGIAPNIHELGFSRKAIWVNDGKWTHEYAKRIKDVEKIFGTKEPSSKLINEWESASPKRRVLDAVAKGVL